MLRTNRPKSCRRVRRGLAATELLLLLPVLLGALLAGVGLADLLVAEQKLDEASGRAARVVSLGGSDTQIKESVKAVLGAERFAHTDVIITPVPGNTADPSGACDLHLVEVRVELEVRYAAATGFVPLSGSEKLVGRTVVHRQ